MAKKPSRMGAAYRIKTWKPGEQGSYQKTQASASKMGSGKQHTFLEDDSTNFDDEGVYQGPRIRES